MKDSVYKTFLEEMHALENFRMGYAAANPSASLDRDDPDVKRLTEALAFFSARTRQAALRNVAATQQRIFRQVFPYLLSPLPAMGLIQATLSGQFTDAVVLPRGTEIAVSSQRDETVLFRTLYDLHVMPLTLKRVDTYPMPGSGFRIALSFKAPFATNADIGRLAFHVNHLNDYHASLRLLFLLRKHLRSVSVVFEEKVDELSKGATCKATFGSPSQDQDDEEALWPHPLQEERAFFHFPQQELFMNVEVPAPPRNWSQFYICLDLDGDWPKNVVVNKSMFQLNTVPVRNLTRTAASPIICEGLRETRPIRHPETASRYTLHSILGVYRIEDEGQTPMRPGILSGGEGSYEIEESLGLEDVRYSKLSINFPAAFEEPRTISVDALWIQRWVGDILSGRLSLSTFRRAVRGAKWDFVGATVHPRECGFHEDMEGFLYLLTLKNKATLDLEDLVGILQSLDSVWEGPFKQLRTVFTGMRVDEVPLQRSGSAGMIKQVYTLTVREVDPAIEPLLQTFRIHVEKILDLWIADAAVEVRLETTKTGGWHRTMTNRVQDLFSPDRLRNRWDGTSADGDETPAAPATPHETSDARTLFEKLSRQLLDRFGTRWKKQLDFFLGSIGEKMDARFPSEGDPPEDEAEREALEAQIDALVIKLEDFVTAIERIA